MHAICLVDNLLSTYPISHGPLFNTNKNLYGIIHGEKERCYMENLARNNVQSVMTSKQN